MTAYHEGYLRAQQPGAKLEDNPYAVDDEKHLQWRRGFCLVANASLLDRHELMTYAKKQEEKDERRRSLAARTGNSVIRHRCR